GPGSVPEPSGWAGWSAPTVRPERARARRDAIAMTPRPFARAVPSSQGRCSCREHEGTKANGPSPGSEDGPQRKREVVVVLVFAGLAATYSSAPLGAVPSALRVFTAEFGMG